LLGSEVLIGSDCLSNDFMVVCFFTISYGLLSFLNIIFCLHGYQHAQIKCLFGNAASGSRTSNSDRIGFFNPVMAFMGQNGEEDGTDVSEKPQSPKNSPPEEENHSTPTKQQTSEVDAYEVSGTTKSPKQPSKLEEAHSSISTDSPVSEQSMTPQTPTHSSAAEEKLDGSAESPIPKGEDSEASETSQSLSHPSPAEETHSDSIENISSVMNENQDNQDRKHSSPSDEALPNQLGESAGDVPDGTASSSPTKIGQSSDTVTGESIHTGQEDTSDGSPSQSQPAESTLASSDDIIEAENKITQESDAPKEISSPHDGSNKVDKTTILEVEVRDGSINTEKNEEESNKTEVAAASVVGQEENASEQPDDFRSKFIIAEHDSHSQNESVVDSTNMPAGLVEDSSVNDFKKEEKIQESVGSTNSTTPEFAGSVAELEKLRREMKMMDAALQGAARQSQVSFLHALISALAIQYFS
jgi:hypothetical protein